MRRSRDGHRNFSLLSSALQLLSLTGVDVTEALVSLMGHDDADLRIQAALALGTQRRPEAIEALIAAFDDPDVNVRFHAIEAVGKQAHPEAIDRLAEIAVSGDFFLAFPAIEALVRIGDPLVAPRLSPLLSDPMLAGVVAEALGRIGDEDAVGSLATARWRCRRRQLTQLSMRSFRFISDIACCSRGPRRSKTPYDEPSRRPRPRASSTPWPTRQATRSSMPSSF